MPIRVACGKCQKQFAAPDRLAGKTVACPACKSPIQIAAPEPELPSILDLLDDSIATSPVHQAVAVPTTSRLMTRPVASQNRQKADALSIKWFFSFNGRISRSQFWLYFGGGMLILALLGGLLEAGAIPEAIPVIVFWLLFGPLIAIQVKRWHDLDKSGAWVLVNAIPFVGALIALIMLGCMPGTSGSNQYGPDPLR